MQVSAAYVPGAQGAAYTENEITYDTAGAKATMKLLIIEDEPAIQEMVSSRLEREGYTTMVAATAEEGMRIFRRTRPNLIVLDLMLPYMSGIDFCKALRRESMTPVIVISAKAEETSRVQALEAGADDYLVKPFSLSELSARVKAVLRRASTTRTLGPVVIGPLKIDPAGMRCILTSRRSSCRRKNSRSCFSWLRTPGKCFLERRCWTRFGGRTRLFPSGRSMYTSAGYGRRSNRTTPIHV